MEHETEIDALKAFAEAGRGIHIESTGAGVTNYGGSLYNVDGSTGDPKHVPNHQGWTWRQLFLSYVQAGACYVANNAGPGHAPAGTSHPQFNVGGHMTPNSNGSVATGGSCYLMPLCSWHNAKSRDGIAFSHGNPVVYLTGYMQMDIAPTFMARFPSIEPYSCVYLAEGVLKARKLTEDAAAGLSYQVLSEPGESGSVSDYVLMKRVIAEDRDVYEIVDAKL